MFGREYSENPEILLSSFRQMNSKYKKIGKKKNDTFQKIYLKLFGIPEIGFQIRSLYFNSIINERLGKKKFNKILDAGSGIGTYAFWLAKKYSSAHIVGGEIDNEKIEFSRDFANKNNVENIEFKKLDVTDSSSKKEKFDLIVNIDVLEHIENYQKVLKNFYNLLSNGGYLYIHTPQINQKRIFEFSRKWAHSDHTHEGYSPEELSGELKKLGFKIVTIKETFGFFGKISWELNHESFKKGLLFAGALYPVLYFLATLDLLVSNKNGLGTAILAQKIR